MECVSKVLINNRKENKELVTRVESTIVSVRGKEAGRRWAKFQPTPIGDYNRAEEGGRALATGCARRSLDLRGFMELAR